MPRQLLAAWQDSAKAVAAPAQACLAGWCWSPITARSFTVGFCSVSIPGKEESQLCPSESRVSAKKWEDRKATALPS